LYPFTCDVLYAARFRLSTTVAGAAAWLVGSSREERSSSEAYGATAPARLALRSERQVSHGADDVNVEQSLHLTGVVVGGKITRRRVWRGSGDQPKGNVARD